MSNKNVKMSADERAVHDRAVALRKKTDSQLVGELTNAWNEGFAKGAETGYARAIAERNSAEESRRSD